MKLLSTFRKVVLPVPVPPLTRIFRRFITEDGEEIVVKPGRYGPYLKRGEDTASIPDDLTPDELTLEKAIELLEFELPSISRQQLIVEIACLAARENELLKEIATKRKDAVDKILLRFSKSPGLGDRR